MYMCGDMNLLIATKDTVSKVDKCIKIYKNIDMTVKI